MSRPLRIQYKDALYHVMSRGKAKSPIFHGREYTNAFLLCLEEASSRFGLEVFAYCLMYNHYHLLVRTPQGNLDRCMRHINGVYTQRHNKMRDTDGPLFRGRYKAILVDSENYLLQVSRYIHRNPIETSPPLVVNLQDYELSSYPAYIKLATKPLWLDTDFVLQMHNQLGCHQKYQVYVEDDMQDGIDNLYLQSEQPLILGGEEFKKNITKKIEIESKEISDKKITKQINMVFIVKIVADYFGISTTQLRCSDKKGGKRNLPRSIAMYLCRKYTDEKLTSIAKFFNVKHYSSVSQASSRLQHTANNDSEIKEIITALTKGVKS